RSAAGSTRPRCSPVFRDPRWSAPAAERRSRGPRSSRAGAASPQSVLLRGRQAEILVRQRGGDAAPRRAIQKSRLDEKGFVNVFERVALFAQGGGEGGHADRAALEFFDDRAQQPAIDLVEAVRVHLQHLERTVGDVGG